MLIIQGEPKQHEIFLWQSVNACYNNAIMMRYILTERIVKQRSTMNNPVWFSPLNKIYFHISVKNDTRILGVGTFNEQFLVTGPFEFDGSKQHKLIGN